MARAIEPADLLFHVLNVGNGDAILVEFPADGAGRRRLGVVDCADSGKMRKYIDKLAVKRPFTDVAFICATHPHGDHIRGIAPLLRKPETEPKWFWESGFRHRTSTYITILETIRDRHVNMLRVSSGMEWYFGPVKVTVLAPSVSLRNRYATYGVDMNNASVVLRFEYCAGDAVTIQSTGYEGTEDPVLTRDTGNPVAILAGDAEFDSWAQVTKEYPHLERPAEHDPLVKKMVNLLKCDFLKVAHHGSMHSAPLEAYERMHPKLAVISNKQKSSGTTPDGGTRYLFPHRIAEAALAEVDADVVTTDASGGGGTVVVALQPGRSMTYVQLGDADDEHPDPPEAV